MDIEIIYSILIVIIKNVGVAIGLAGICILTIYIRLKLNKRRMQNE